MTKDTRFARVHPRVALSLLGTLAASCGAPRAAWVDASPIAIVAAPAVEAPPPIEPPPAPRVGPLRREAPILFQPSIAHAAISPLSRAVRGWAARRDGATRVELGCRRGTTVVDARGKRPVTGAATRVAIAGDGAEVAREHAGRIHRTPLGTATVPAVLDGTDAIYLEGAEGPVLAFHRGCEWFAATKGGPGVPIGTSCGVPIRVEHGRTRLWLAEPAGPGVTGIPAIVGLEPGQPPIAIDLADSPGMSAPAMSADATILCGTFVDAGHDVLSCRLRDGGEFEPVAKDVFGAAHFADDARRLVFTVGDRAHVPRELHLVDFDHRIVRRLGRVAHHRLAFLPGGEHVVAFDGARGLVFELDTGWVTPFGEETDDWVALGGADRPGSFLASRLRSRCAELVRVDLPSRDAG